MKFKTLKHKDLPYTFGIILNKSEGQISDADAEIYHSSKPELLGIETDMELLKKMYQYTFVIDQIEDYEIVEIEVLLKNELPSKILEKSVLSDYLDWYKNKYGGVEMISEYWINEFVSGR